MKQTGTIPMLKEDISRLEKRVRRLESDLSYHVKREKELVLKTKGAISTEFGAFLLFTDVVIYEVERGISQERLLGICREHLHEQLGTMYTVGRLTEEVNLRFGGIIDCMAKDYPDFGPYEKNLYSCMVAGVSVYLIMQTFDLGTTQKASGEKTALIRRIWKKGNRGRVKYMELLER
ncbi:MAG: hypothetical protein J6W94_07125 [Bacteroidales bacterium]|nr:hypothetical protein [Bacteroidales bacterium]MBP5676764.1 hypothetical protein [Bacteroidales bacterium]